MTDNLHPPVFASGGYYTKSDFSAPIIAIDKEVKHPTILKNKPGINIFYFYDDNGQIIVNSKEYQTKHGLLMFLGSYHYFQLKPKKDTMHLIKCQISYDTFLYMAANPYYDFNELTLASTPLNTIVNDEYLVYTEKILNDLVDITGKHNKKGGRTEFFFSMKLIGIMQMNFDRSILKNEN